MKARLIIIAAFSMAMAVALGALGAHYLKGQVEKGILSPDHINSFETAVKYQIYHSIVLLIIASTELKNLPKWISSLMILGMILFSGSIYLLSTRTLTGFSNLSFLGPITPVGGLLLITAWLSIAFYLVKKKL
jgi:uncharacterized membrane protein YgdD (TMEM256/DUF423 family)